MNFQFLMQIKRTKMFYSCFHLFVQSEWTCVLTRITMRTKIYTNLLGKSPKRKEKNYPITRLNCFTVFIRYKISFQISPKMFLHLVFCLKFKHQTIRKQEITREKFYYCTM
uniref:Uncharacterized protein n=1 Tax=Cacopsylla melanoneura TaxID=428564 RepID=A0A8D8R551_9HEMI